MKSYVKPSLEVISMKTTENIADNWIKTLYTRSSGTSFSAGNFGDANTTATYLASNDSTNLS